MRVPVLAALLFIAAGCGGYTHHKTMDNIIATAWSRDGVAVHLVQQVRFEWGFVGLAPHIVDPRHDLGPLFLVSDKGRIRIPGYDDWWEIDYALPRQAGLGFVTGGHKSGFRACLLIDLQGHVSHCPAAVDENNEFAHYSGLRDALVLSGRGTAIDSVDLVSGRQTSLDDPVWQVGLARQGPCGDLSYSALSPAEEKWVIACRGALVTAARDGGPVTLLPLEGDLHMPDWLAFRDMEDHVRPFWQEFGLAWAPDGKRVYYCGNKKGPAVVVEVPTKEARRVQPCLTGATWSPDGKRVVGVSASRTVGEVRIQ